MVPTRRWLAILRTAFTWSLHLSVSIYTQPVIQTTLGGSNSCAGIGRWVIGSTVQVMFGDSGWHVILHWFISPGLLISFLRYLTWHILDFHYSRAWFLYTYVLLFSGKLYGFYSEGFLCSKKEKCVFKNFVFAHSRFLFFAPPGFRCWKFVSTRIFGESQYRWLPLRVRPLPTLLYFIMLWRRVWIGFIPAHNTLLSLDIIRFKLFHIFHITILYDFVTFLVSPSIARFGVLVDIPGWGVSKTY